MTDKLPVKDLSEYFSTIKESRAKKPTEVEVPEIPKPYELPEARIGLIERIWYTLGKGVEIALKISEGAKDANSALRYLVIALILAIILFILFRVF